MAKQTTELTEAAGLLSQAATSLINSPLGLIQNGATSRESILGVYITFERDLLLKQQNKHCLT